jgi:hypothetical protein
MLRTQPKLKRVLLGLLTLAMAGCSNQPVATTDLANAFAGTWEGTTTVTIAGQHSYFDASVRMIRMDVNSLMVAGLCVDGSGPPATVTSATAFTIGVQSCPAQKVTGCSSEVVSTQSGRGLLTDDSRALAFLSNGTIAGCGQRAPFTLFFLGARQGGAPLPPPENLGFTPSQLDLVEVSPNQGPGPFAELRLTNFGASTAVGVTFQGFAAIESSPPDELIVDASGCPADLNSAESCMVRVALNPISFGFKAFRLVATDASGFYANATISGNSGRYVELTLTAGGHVTSQPAGIDCPGQCYATFSDGTALILTADEIPSGYTVKWSGDCTPSGNECSATVNADLHVSFQISQ